MNATLQEVDKLQRLVARLIATNRVGVGLLLIGGFRYRLLDHSPRLSVDIDYHWDGELAQKQQELQQYCARVVVKEIKRRFGHEGSASKVTGPDADSPNAAFVELRFWKPGHLIEIPIEVTRVARFDPPAIRTAEGVVHSTLSDADIIEGKVVAVLNRTYLQHRDLVDLFLYADKLRPDSSERIGKKTAALGIRPETIRARLDDLRQSASYHATAIQSVVDTQMEPASAQQIAVGGGGQKILEQSLELLTRVCPR